MIIVLPGSIYKKRCLIKIYRSLITKRKKSTLSFCKYIVHDFLNKNEDPHDPYKNLLDKSQPTLRY